MPTAGRQGKSGGGQRTGTAKNPREQWIAAMRGRTGALTGCMRNGVDTGRPPSRNAATASSSQYLKSVMTGRTMSTYKEVPLTQKLPSGTPAYKPQEDMYDEIIDLKKTVVQQKTENDTLKSRVGRLEEANKAKEKQIEQLLDPTKSNALKAAVYNSKPDGTTMVNNQKQRILKLEQTIRERDNTISAMKDDMRATRLQELEMQADIYFQEMQRLQAAPQSSKERPPSKESSAKVKALNDTILRLTDANQRLQAENKGLRQDLDKAMEGDRKELLDKIKKLEQDRSAMGSQVSLVSSKGDDKKDDERHKLKSTVRRLKEDRDFYRNQAQEKEKEVEDLNSEVARLREKLIKMKQERLAREKEEREAKQQDSAARSIQKNWRSHRAKEEGREMRKRLIAERDEEKRQQRERSRERRDREEKEKQEQDMAAAKIQKNWRKHKTSRQKEEELNEAAQLIQSSARGHFTRQRQLREEETETETEESSSDMETAATRVQSSVRGHWARSEQLQDKEKSPRRKSLDRDEAAMLIQSSVRGHWSRQNLVGEEVGSKSDMDTTTADDSSDEDVVVVSRPSSRPSSRPPSRTPSRPSSRGSIRSTASGDRLRDPQVPSRSSLASSSRSSGSAADVRTASPSNDSDSDSDVVMPTIRKPTPAPRRIMEVV